MKAISLGFDSASQVKNSLQELGWDVPAERLMTDAVVSVRGIGWGIGRANLPGGRFQTARQPRRVFRIFLLVEGEIVCIVNNRQIPVRAGESISIRSDQKLVVLSKRPWLRYEWLLRSNWPAEERILAVPWSPAYQKLFVSVSDSLLEHPEISEDQGSAAIWDVMASIMSSMRATLRGIPVSLTPYREAQYQKAVGTIEELYGDPTFSVEILAQSTGASLSALHAVFKAAGTTPRRAIEERRVRAAFAHLSVLRNRSYETLQKVATEVGFRSVKQLKSAMNRQMGPDRDL